MTKTPPNISRRNVLKSIAALPVIAATTPVFAASSGALQNGFITQEICFLSVESTEGPYYLDSELVRANITEGKKGIPLDMHIQVVDTTCTPLENARVDIWHCDAEGNYSGYANQGGHEIVDTEGQAFLRGTQFTDASGIAKFNTIYPGWYAGRTTHIHYKIYLDETSILTSQLFFPDALSEYLFNNISPYSDREIDRDMLNADDWIAQNSGDGAYAAIREQADRYVASLVVGVNAASQHNADLPDVDNGQLRRSANGAGKRKGGGIVPS